MSAHRHFKALMRKNWINWKRTPFGSLIEVLCPSVLMLVLVYLRIAMPAQTIGDGSFSGLKHPLFSVT